MRFKVAMGAAGFGLGYLIVASGGLSTAHAQSKCPTSTPALVQLSSPTSLPLVCPTGYHGHGGLQSRNA